MNKQDIKDVIDNKVELMQDTITVTIKHLREEFERLLPNDCDCYDREQINKILDKEEIKSKLALCLTQSQLDNIVDNIEF